MKYLYLVALLFVLPANADIYTWVNDQGNVVFTDEPRPGAKVVEVQETLVYTSPSTPVVSDVSPQEENKVPEVIILSPTAGEAVWANGGSVSVVVSSHPALNTESGYRFTATVDGKIVEGAKSAQNFTVPVTERGAHTVAVSLVSQEGHVIAKSEPVSFHVHRATVN